MDCEWHPGQHSASWRGGLRRVQIATARTRAGLLASNEKHTAIADYAHSSAQLSWELIQAPKTGRPGACTVALCVACSSTIVVIGGRFAIRGMGSCVFCGIRRPSQRSAVAVYSAALLAATPPEALPRARSCQREPCLRDGACVCVSRWQVRESTACAARRDAALLAVRDSCLCV